MKPRATPADPSPTLTFDELEVFCALHEAHSFSNAAKSLGRAQPTVSQIIGRLEDKLGQRLFTRDSRRVTPTAAGQVLHDHAQRLLHQRTEALEALAALRQPADETLRLVATECVSLYLLPQLIQLFRKRFPEVRIEARRCTAEALPDLLRGEADLALTGDELPMRQLAALELVRDEVLLIAPPDHPLAGRGPLEMGALKGQPVVAYAPATAARKRLLGRFEAADAPLRLVMELPSIPMIKAFVGSGEGLAFLPRIAVEPELKTGRLVALPVEGLKLERTLRMIWNTQRPLSAAAQAFVSLRPPK